MQLVILNRNNLPKEALCGGLTFQCYEKGWVIQEIMVK